MDLRELHDATLLGINMRWRENEVRIEFQLHQRLIVMTMTGVDRLVCPHENPWGPSASVNEIRMANAQAEMPHLVEIEMQSGDVICVRGRSVVWT